MSKLTLTVGTMLAIGVLAGCGGSSAGRGAAEAAPRPAQEAKSTPSKGPKLKVVESDYGRILADGHGRALYLFTADAGKTSSCSGDCSAAWPPWIVKRKPHATLDLTASLIGTTRRDDGRLQATYRGHPLYYYVGDRVPGQVLCQAVSEFGGFWYVVRSSGKAVR